MLDSNYVRNQIDNMGVSCDRIAKYMHESPFSLRSRLNGKPSKEFLLKVLAAAMEVKQIIEADKADNQEKPILKNGFMIYFDAWRELDLLPDDQFKELFYRVFKYAETGEENGLYSDNAVKIAFLSIKRRIDEDAARYAAVVEQKRLAGIRSGEVRNMNKLTKHYNVYVESRVPKGEEYNE